LLTNAKPVASITVSVEIEPNKASEAQYALHIPSTGDTAVGYKIYSFVDINGSGNEQPDIFFSDYRGEN